MPENVVQNNSEYDTQCKVAKIIKDGLIGFENKDLLKKINGIFPTLVSITGILLITQSAELKDLLGLI